MVRALVLCSGGQDSLLTIALLRKYSIEVIALNFVSYFFGGPSEKMTSFAKQLNVPVVFVPFQQEQFEVTLHPKCGRGKNFNACIDCHALMIRYAGNLLSKYNADFIATGEVLNQRPMSQNGQSMKTVAKLSGFADKLVRPLCGKLIEKTEVEKQGLLPNDCLRSICGKGQEGQYALAKELGVDFKKVGHAGGCILTERMFALRLKLFESDNVLNQCSFIPSLIQYGRLARLDSKVYCVIGRDQSCNQVIKQYAHLGTFLNGDYETPGPAIFAFQMRDLPTYNHIQDIENDIVAPGECSWCHQYENYSLQNVKGDFHIDDQYVQTAIDIFSLFCKGKGNTSGLVSLNGREMKFQPLSEERKKDIRSMLVVD